MGVLTMTEYFAGGHLRFVNGEWRNDDGDIVEISRMRHGRWIYHRDSLFPCDSRQECSCCHEEEYFTLYNENYCPNCGAKMDGGTDDE